MTLPRLRFVLGLLATSVLFSSGAQAAWNDPVTNTPAIIQIDFGAHGLLEYGNFYFAAGNFKTISEANDVILKFKAVPNLPR